MKTNQAMTGMANLATAQPAWGDGRTSGHRLGIALERAYRLLALPVRRWRHGSIRIATARALDALDDRTLRDIGIDRGMIPGVAAGLADDRS